MRRITRMVFAGLFLIGITVMGGSESFAGSGSPEGGAGTGTPPYGVAVQSAAQGIKLTGIVTIEYYNFTQINLGDYVADARIVARLSKGSVMKTLKGEAVGVNYSNTTAIQVAIESVMEEVIIREFFGGDTSLSVTVKSFDDLGEVDFGFFPGGTSTVVADVVLAVK